uniref:Uncharacterized protein n=1 Tax=Dictyoglomus turgidum TaxID=513050 RepID=A0A7C3SQI9_9BACT
MKESHGYRFISRVSEPQKAYEELKPFLEKNYMPNDLGRNCVFKAEGMTIMLSLTKGKLTIYSSSGKSETTKKLRELFKEESIQKEAISNLRLNKKEIRNHIGLPTKKGYCDYHYYENDPPSPSLNLPEKLDGFDVRILCYTYENILAGTGLYKRFGVTYHKFKRRLDKLARLRLLEKLGKSPALYTMIKDKERAYLVKEFIGLWNKLFHSTLSILVANLQKMQNTYTSNVNKKEYLNKEKQKKNCN